MLTDVLARHAGRQIASRHALEHLLGLAERLHHGVEHAVRAGHQLRVGAAEPLGATPMREIPLTGRVAHATDLAHDPLQRAGGVVDAFRQHVVVRTHGNGRGQVAGGEPVGRARHAAEIVDHLAEGLGERTDLVVSGDLDSLRQAAAGDLRGGLRQSLERIDDAPQRTQREHAEHEQ